MREVFKDYYREVSVGRILIHHIATYKRLEINPELQVLTNRILSVIYLRVMTLEFLSENIYSGYDTAFKD